LTLPTTESATEPRIYRISPEEFELVKPLLAQHQERGGLVIAQARGIPVGGSVTPPPSATNTSTGNSPTSAVPAVTQAADSPERPVPEAPPSEVPPPDTCAGLDGLMVDLSGIDIPSDEGAIIILVVVGVVVVLSVVVYAAAFLYALAIGSGDVGYWWDLEAHGSLLFGNESDGYMSGIRFSSGLENMPVMVGLVLEGGQIQADMGAQSPLGITEISGAYGLAGAGVRWALGGYESNPTYLGFDLLGGTAADENVNLMSVARANISLGFSPHLRFGFSLGALYMGLEADDGLIQDIDNFSTMTGVQIGYRF
jgi:hypothetical protein